MSRLRTVQNTEDIATGSFKLIDSAKLAHDLKGPLNSIKGLVVIAGGDIKDKKAQRYFKLIEKYQELLYSRINDALNKVNTTDSISTSSGYNKNSILGGVRLSLNNIGGGFGTGFGTLVSQKSPFSERLYRASTVVNIMRALQEVYFNRNFSASGNTCIDLVKLAHDIKGPLNSIKGLLDVARIEVDNESARNYFELIGKCHQQLYSRVEEALKRMDEKDEGSKAILIKFDSVIDEIQSSLGHMDGFSDIEHNIVIENTRPFYTDADAIYSIIQNLYENAIKYRKHDASSHTVELKISDTDAGIKIQVADNGIGIREELFSKIFKFKFRDENTPEKGHGIGLALVKQLTQRLNGKILFESKFGKGTTFTVEIPRNTSH